MEKFVISGGKPLKGVIKVSGAKNVAMKTVVASLLTDSFVTVKNIPLISDVTGTVKFIEKLGVKIKFKDNSVQIDASTINKYSFPLDMDGLYRTVTMVIPPLLLRFGKAIVPNPGGCRIGQRPIDRHIQGLKAFGAQVEYKDGFFHAKANKLHNTKFRFSKNTHTGTESMILLGTLIKGKTVLENSAEEPEVDDLINFLNSMGARIKRKDHRIIEIDGVSSLKGTNYTIMPDRNEAVTFAIGAYITNGDITINEFNPDYLEIFLNKLNLMGLKFDINKNSIRFHRDRETFRAVDVTTSPHPGFMTDWQPPWSVLVCNAKGTSSIHETVYESRFAYVNELRKMGAKIDFFQPKITNPKEIYNFNLKTNHPNTFQAIKILGPVKLHNAVVEVSDLRAGATLVLAALSARGDSIIYGIEHIDRGYEQIEKRFNHLGASIKRIHE